MGWLVAGALLVGGALVLDRGFSWAMDRLF